MKRQLKLVAWLNRFWLAWQEFWFEPMSCEHLAAMRWLVGGMLVYTHWVWGIQLNDFFSSTGWISLEALRTITDESTATSFWWFVPDEHLRVVHTVCLLILVAFMVGLATPLTSVLAMIITVSNSNRVLIANYGLDQILVLLTFYMAIGGCGGAYSVDQWIRSRWRNRSLSPADRIVSRKTSRARLGTRLIQVHYAIIYFAAGTSKMLGEAWWNGEAVWMALANAEYQSIDMTWLAHYPQVIQILTHLTVLFEISFVFLIWNNQLRPMLLAVGVAMHMGIALCMGMPTFGLGMLYGYLAFIRPQRIRQIVRFFVRMFSHNSSQYQFSAGSEVYLQAKHRLLFLEPATSSKRPMAFQTSGLQKIGYDIQRTSSIAEFESKLMDGVYSSSLIAMDRFSSTQVCELVPMIERLSAHRIACVVMLRIKQIDWLERVNFSPTVRILVIPFQQSNLLEQITWSMHHADEPVGHFLDSDPGGFMMPIPKDPD